MGTTSRGARPPTSPRGYDAAADTAGWLFERPAAELVAITTRVGYNSRGEDS